MNKNQIEMSALVERVQRCNDQIDDMQRKFDCDY
jgi:hypothetical protein